MKTLNELGFQIVDQVNKNIQQKEYTNSPKNSLVYLCWSIKFRDKMEVYWYRPKNVETVSELKKQVYPGWEGNIYLAFNNLTNTSIPNYFINTDGHISAGGIVSTLDVNREFLGFTKKLKNQKIQSYRWNFKIFSDDYPEIYQEEQKKIIEFRINQLLAKPFRSADMVQHAHKFIYINKDNKR